MKKSRFPEEQLAAARAECNKLENADSRRDVRVFEDSGKSQSSDPPQS